MSGEISKRNGKNGRNKSRVMVCVLSTDVKMNFLLRIFPSRAQRLKIAYRKSGTCTFRPVEYLRGITPILL